jgi:hypothetical protein
LPGRESDCAATVRTSSRGSLANASIRRGLYPVACARHWAARTAGSCLDDFPNISTPPGEPSTPTRQRYAASTRRCALSGPFRPTFSGWSAPMVPGRTMMASCASSMPRGLSSSRPSSLSRTASIWARPQNPGHT